MDKKEFICLGGKIMAEFLTELDVKCLNDDVWVTKIPLKYKSDLVGEEEVPADFYTDFASVPRIPIVFAAWGNTAHREATLHDFNYRSDNPLRLSRAMADKIFLESMKATGKPFRIYYPMYLGVRLAGWTAYHKKKVEDKL
jgi:hypothetical protein